MINPRQRAYDLNRNTTAHDTTSTSQTSSNTDQFAENLLTPHNDGVIGIDKNGCFTFVNKTACKLTGWSQDELKNKKLEDVFQVNDNASIKFNIKLITNIISSNKLFGPIESQVIKTKDNQELLVNFSISPLDAETVILMFHPKISNNSKTSRNLLYQVNYDPLTRIKNRHTIQQIITLLHNTYKKENKKYSIFLLNIDRFKLINDCYGHDTGDQLLQLIAERIQHCIRIKDDVGRWAGEEFICILPDADIKTACNIAQRLCDDISSQAFLTDSQKILITASIGVANFPNDGDSPDGLFSIANATLYEAKKNGRNRIHSSQQVTGNIYSIGSQLDSALNDNRITPVYQPIFELKTGEKVAEEALARIKEKNGALIEASEFIDAAIELQMVHRIDYQIIMKMISRCAEQFMTTKNAFPHFVNISADLLRHPQLIKEIIQLVKIKCAECGLGDGDDKPIVIEITEQEFFGDKNEVQTLLAPFIDAGMPLAIDDFGSGYSSLTYLADLPIRYLKFDGSLIKRVAYEDRARKIINGIQQMAESLELITIAEHIENQATLDVLLELGVDWGQGYFSAKPVL